MWDPPSIHEAVNRATDVTLRATIILSLAGIAALLLRRASAALRHLVWSAAILGLLLLPALVTLLPQWKILPQWPQHSSPISTATLDPTPSDPTAQPIPSAPAPDWQPQQNASNALPTSASIAVPPHASSPWNWEVLTLQIWVAGTAIMLLPMLLARAALRRLQRRSHKCTDETGLTLLAQLQAELALKKQITLLEGPPDSAPMTFGLLRPTLLVPAKSRHWPAAHWRMVLRHELAHIRRRDVASQVLAQLARALYWFHPLAWLACARMAAEREAACDDMVVTGGFAATEYAEQLLAAAAIYGRCDRTTRLACHASVPMARISTLESRLRALLNIKKSRGQVSALLAFVTVVLTVAVLVPVALVQAAANPPKVTTEPSTVPPGAVAKFKVGGRMELVAIMEYPSKDQQSWGYDGTKVPSFTTMGFHIPEPQLQRTNMRREFVFRRIGLPADATWTFYTDPSYFNTKLNVVDTHENVLKDYTAFAGLIPDLGKTVSVFVGVASGEWSKVAEGIDLKDKSPPNPANNNYSDSYSISAVREEKGKAAVNIEYFIFRAEVRITAIDQQGKEHSLGSSSNTIMGNTSFVGATFDLPAKELKAVRLQKRLYEWAELKNVPLQPAAAPQPKNPPATTAAATQDVRYLVHAGDPSYLLLGKEVDRDGRYPLPPGIFTIGDALRVAGVPETDENLLIELIRPNPGKSTTVWAKPWKDAKNTVLQVEDTVVVADKKSASSSPEKLPDTPWGDPVEGIFCRIRLAPIAAQPGSMNQPAAPPLLVDIRNDGKRQLITFQTRAELSVQWDGIWYRWTGGTDAKSSDLGPGRHYESISLNLTSYGFQQSWEDEKNNLLQLTPGPHKIRVATTCDPLPGSADKEVHIESSELTITVGSPPASMPFTWNGDYDARPAKRTPASDTAAHLPASPATEQIAAPPSSPDIEERLRRRRAQQLPGATNPSENTFDNWVQAPAATAPSRRNLDLAHKWMLEILDLAEQTGVNIQSTQGVLIPPSNPFRQAVSLSGTVAHVTDFLSAIENGKTELQLDAVMLRFVNKNSDELRVDLNLTGPQPGVAGLSFSACWRAVLSNCPPDRATLHVFQLQNLDRSQWQLLGTGNSNVEVNAFQKRMANDPHFIDVKAEGPVPNPTPGEYSFQMTFVCVSPASGSTTQPTTAPSLP